MLINDPIHYLPATIALLIFASMLVLTHSAPPPPEKACSDEVIAFAPCLPYISNPPNNQTKSPSSQCCNLFASAFDSGTANCLCYLLRDSHLLGFPLNRTRFLSLSSLCVPKDNSGSNGKQTLESLCSGRRHPPPPPRSKPPAKPGHEWNLKDRAREAVGGSDPSSVQIGYAMPIIHFLHTLLYDL
ncbi:hypothetical protein LguiA_030944 [Lonicera macranthoides]